MFLPVVEFLIFVLSVHAAPSDKDAGSVRRYVRQTLFTNQFLAGSLVQPILFQNNVNLAQPSSAITPTCVGLTGIDPPVGCTYTPSIVDPSTNRVVSCTLDCSANPNSFQLSPISGILSSVNPDYLTSGFIVDDQSNRDVFVGDSYFLFTAPPTTTVPTIIQTTTVVGTLTATTAVVTSGTVATVPSVVPTLAPSQVANCIQLNGPPPVGCVYNSNGEMNLAALTCAISCPDGTAELQIAACTAKNGPPPANCVYNGRGEGDTLTCPLECTGGGF